MRANSAGKDTKDYFFQTVDEFADQLKGLLRDNPRYAKNVDKGIMPEGYLEAPLAYDAIWAVALGKLLICSGVFCSYGHPEVFVGF